MREPQDTSTLGQREHQGGRRRQRAVWRLAVCAVLVMAVCLPTMVPAQIRGAPPSAPDYGWWISGGASAVVLGDITDGRSQSVWRFGSDPLWQFRASLEKSLDEFTTLGVSTGYGRVPLTLSAIGDDSSAFLPSACQRGCAATTELWSAMAQFRSGGGTGFHTLFEASGGGTIFRNFATADSAIAIDGITRSFDLSGTLGAGFAYPLSRTAVISLVQDFGIGFHAKTDLPEGTGRTWRVRNTRASLRIKFGGR